MRKFSGNEADRMLRDGLWFIAPFSGTPSRYPPFRAIIEAAEGKRKVDRRRFIRLVMSTGNGRRAAEYLAFAVHRNGISYRDALQRAMVPAIMLADEKMERYQGPLVMISE